MSDTPTPFLGRYRALPMWAQVLIPVVIVAILIGLIVVLTSADSDDATSADTTVAGESSLDGILRGIILIGGIRAGETTATTVVDTTESVTTESATTAVPETTELTVAPEATSTTTAPTTTQSPTTTPTPTATTEPAPTTTDPDSPGLPSPADFISQWNDATARTDVPEITEDQIDEIVDGPFAGAFLVTLVPDVDDPKAPQVGLIGTMSAADPTQIAELLLVYVNGPDESASDFYWEAFGVLTRAVEPATTDEQLAELEASLGRADDLPPFPDDTDNVATSNGFTFNLYTGATQEGTPATGIAVT